VEIKALDHSALICADLERTRWFYGAVLGLEETPRPPTLAKRLTRTCRSSQTRLWPRVSRPHAAAGTAKAAADGWALGEVVRAAGGDVVAALQRWEAGQLQLGRAVLERTRTAGQRVQFEQRWQIGEPLPFGLYSVGDSLCYGV